MRSGCVRSDLVHLISHFHLKPVVDVNCRKLSHLYDVQAVDSGTMVLLSTSSPCLYCTLYVYILVTTTL